MKILITGATGFIGKNLVRELRKCGHQVRCLVRDLRRAEDLVRIGSEIVQGDFSDPSSIKDGVNGCQVVYHLAGSVYGRSWKGLYEINALGTKKIYEIVSKSSVGRFIYLSSIAAVGPQKYGVPIDENAIPNPISRYGKSKFFAERFIETLQKERPITTVIVRPPMIYGLQSNPQSRIFLLMKKLQEGKFYYIGSGQNEISICDVNSLVAFLASLATLNLKCGVLEKVHVAHDQALTFEELVETICEQINVKPPSRRISFTISYILGTVMDFLQYWVDGEDLITTERVLEITGNWKVSNAKAKTLGFCEKTNVIDGLRETLNQSTWSVTR